MADQASVIKVFSCPLCGRSSNHEEDAQRCYERCTQARAAEQSQTPDAMARTLLREELQRGLEPIFDGLRTGMEQVAELEALKRKEFLTSKEVARLYGIPYATLDTLRSRGGGPAYHQVHRGGTVLYRHEDIREYVTRARVRG
ncbi:hypothetical protein DA2_1432 [Desulfovibrio sp. A2]|nr:hypothetical protein DA2_1432 [Desulfovibrio sp. A2]